MIAVDLEKVLLAVCQGCNEEFSEEPCEPGCCRIRERLEKLPRVTLDDLRPKGRWEPKERAMWLPYYNGGLDRREYRCSKCWNRTTNKKHPRRLDCGSHMLREM